MEKESKVKVSRTSASARNSNDINIKVMVGDQPKKKRVYRRKPKPQAQPPQPVVQNVVELPPTTVAVPNIAFGRPQYAFTAPRPYDDPAGGTVAVPFPELVQNFQARQELMGMPPQTESIQTVDETGQPMEAPAMPEEAPAMAEEAPAMPEEAPAMPEEGAEMPEEMPVVEPVAPLPEGRPLTQEEIQMIAEEAGRRSMKKQAVSALDTVLAYLYDTTDPDVLRELKASLIPEGTTSQDVWRQLGAMAQRMPPSAQRDAMIQLIVSNTPSPSAPPRSIAEPSKRPAESALSFELGLLKAEKERLKRDIDMIENSRSRTGRLARGDKPKLTQMKRELKEIEKALERVKALKKD